MSTETDPGIQTTITATARTPEELRREAPRQYREMVLAAAAGQQPDAGELRDVLFWLSKTVADFTVAVRALGERQRHERDLRGADQYDREIAELQRQDKHLREVYAQVKAECDARLEAAAAPIRELDASARVKELAAAAGQQRKTAREALLATADPEISRRIKDAEREIAALQAERSPHQAIVNGGRVGGIRSRVPTDAEREQAQREADRLDRQIVGQLARVRELEDDKLRWQHGTIG